MKLYADSDYYTESFYENMPECEIPSEERLMYLKKASAFLDSLFLHQKPQKPFCDELKSACCEIADCMYTYSQREGISSESNDGYSVTYSSAGGSNAVYKNMYAIAKRYLANTGLLYRGI